MKEGTDKIMNETQKYSAAEISSMGQTELESRAFIRTAASLNMIKEHWDAERKHLEEALDKNRRLWTIIASAMKEDNCPQPVDVRNNILNLALFVFRRTMDILSDPKPESLNVLININMNIARGLSGNGEQEEK